MARTHYSVTFPAARPGDEVTWPNTVTVYPDADTQVPLQSGQSLDESLAFDGWSEAASIVFTRPAGDNDTVTVTTGSPSGTGAAAPPSGGSSETYLEVVQDVLLDGLQHFVTGFTDNNGAPTVGTSVAWNEGDGAVEFTDAGIYTVTYWARGDTGGDGGIPSDGALQLSSTNLFTDPVCPLVQVSLAGTLSIRGAASYRRHFDAGEALSPRVWIRGDDPAKNTGLRVGIWITT